jgi:hypothetical protein
VYERFTPVNEPTKHKTKLISATTGGHAGNGASSHPAINGDGTVVAFETAASNLLHGDHNKVSDIARFEFHRSHPCPAKAGSRDYISHVDSSNQGENGDSHNPAVTDDGCYVAFDSERSNLNYADDDTDLDAYLWTNLRGNHDIVLLSQDPSVARSPASQPDISARGNYSLFRGGQPGKEQIWLGYLGPQ